MNRTLIIGATSGIGRELARLYAAQGHLVGATGRRQELLYSLQGEYPDRIATECFDVTGPDVKNHLTALVKKLGGLDVLIYSAGWGEPQEALEWTVDKATVDVNVNGFLEAIHFGWRLFAAQGHGHLVTISSIASIRGNYLSPAYSASKSFQSIYFEGLYIKARKLKIPLYVTDIQPGFVDTHMAKGPRFWVAPADKAARQIARAIEQKRWRVYITHRWWIVAKLFRWVPSWIYHRLSV